MSQSALVLIFAGAFIVDTTLNLLMIRELTKWNVGRAAPYYFASFIPAQLCYAILDELQKPHLGGLLITVHLLIGFAAIRHFAKGKER